MVTSDGALHPNFPLFLAKQVSAFANGAGGPGPARVLDLGCGYGKSATALEPRGLEVHGIDVSPAAIERCRRLVRHPERFHSASADRLPFDEDFFDIVLDPQRQPVFIHCKRGKDRTGTMVALYRIEVNGWSNAEAIAEMDAFGYTDYYRDLKRFVTEYQARGLTQRPR